MPSAGLSAPDLDAIRATLAAGRKPRVVFTEAAGQIVGQAGQVIALTEPPVGEWIVVRFGRDELPFSPTDLAVPPKAPPRPKARDTNIRNAKVPEATVPESTARDTKLYDTTPADTGAGAIGSGATGSNANGYSANGSQAIGSRANGSQGTPLAPAEHSQSPTASTKAAAVPPPRKEVVPMTSPADSVPAARKAARAPKPKPPAALTVTLSYVDGDWMVGAQQGAKALAKPYVIKAAEALRMVALLDVPGVHEAVEQIVEAERTAAQAHAEKLRAELAEIEARLADLPHADQARASR